MGLYLMAGVYDLNTDEKIPEGYHQRLLLRQPVARHSPAPMVSTAGKRY
jgi:hypothetical protein